MKNTNCKPLSAPNATPSLKNILIRLVKGILIGIGAILPGLSGGVLSVIFGVYDPMIRFLSHIGHRFKENVFYFLPIGVGGLLGVLLFSVVVVAAFGRFQAQFVCLFIGFVIGTFPSLYRQAGKEGRNGADLFILALCAAGIFSLMFAGKGMPTVQPNPLVWFLSGATVALGFIVPGMSPSNFLIYFGLYDKMSAAIAAFDFSMLLPFGAGGVLCIILFSKLVAHLFDRHYSKMYHAILGMVVGSSLAIFPTTVFPAFTAAGLAQAGLSFGAAFLFALLLLAAGIACSYAFSKVEDRVSAE